MKTRDIISTLNKVLEYLDDVVRDPDTSQYLADKAETLIEDIETLLGQSEVEE